MKSSAPDRAAVSPSVIEELCNIVGPAGVHTSLESRMAYECDAYTIAKGRADVVVIPTRSEQVAPIIRVLAREKIPFVPRGAGTGLAGGVYVAQRGVLLVLSRLQQILELNPAEAYAVVEPGVVNLHLTRAAEPYGYCYAPDPSSQSACTIGGNVANNSGGPHTLKSGVTTNHVLGLEVVLPDGDVVTVAGLCEDAPGYDLRGLLVGSEGTLGVVTKIFVRLTRIQPAWKTLLAVFPSFESATRGVSAIISAGVVPAALELMDHLIISAVEQAFKIGLPLDAGAVLLIELDGLAAGLERSGERVAELCRQEGATEVRVARDAAERAALWSGRKKAAAAIGRLSPSYCTQDVVIPRSRLPEMAVKIEALAKEHGLRIANLLHAGDGNLHPLTLFDERVPEQVERMIAVNHAIVRRTIELGGSVTGEHGIGIEKVEFMRQQFSADDLEIMERVKRLFDPELRSNPCKLLPTGGTCMEIVPKKQAAA